MERSSAFADGQKVVTFVVGSPSSDEEASLRES
jgi:hypothetical protein